MNLAAVALLALLLSEYGFRFRREAMLHLRGQWRWRAAAIRLGVWLLVFVTHSLPNFERASPLWFLIFAAYTEVVAWVLRWLIRRDLNKQRPHGSPLSHLLPIAACLGVALVPGAAVEIAFQTVAISIAILPAVIIAMFTWGTLFSVAVVEIVRPASSRTLDEPATEKNSGAGAGAGEIIGILERLVVFFLVLNGGLTAVGFVIAAKSAARFPQFKQPEFAEYFLIGTLCSVGVAALAGRLAAII